MAVKDSPQNSWTSRRTVAWIISLGCSIGLAIGFLDVILAIAADPRGYPSAFSIFPPLALTAAAAFIGFLILVLLWIPVARRIRSSVYSTVAGLGCFAIVMFALLWIGDLKAISTLTADAPNVLLKAAILGLAAAGAGVATWHALQTRTKGENAETRILLLFGSISLLLGASAVLLYLLNSFPTSGLLGATTIIGFVVVLFVSLWGLRFANQKGTLRHALVICLLIIIASPSITYTAWSRQIDPSVGRPRPDRPIRQVVLVTIDTLRRDSLSIYGPRGVTTPNIDSLAENSLVYTNAFASAPWTIPSVISMMTGVCADVHAVEANVAEIPPQYATFAEYMSDAGYLTAAIGWQPQLLRMGRGFLHFDFAPKSPRYPEESVGGKILWHMLYEPGTTEGVTDAARQWLEQNADKDYFLWVHYVPPHIPYAPPGKFIEPDPSIAMYGKEFDNVASWVRSGRIIRTESERRWMHLLYEAEVRHVDHEIGRLLSTMHALQLYDDALIILTSDHGEEFWDHGNWEHGHTLYNELVSAALLVKLPNGKTRKSIDTLVSNISIMPTVLDLCGVEYQEISMTVRPLPVLNDSYAASAKADPVFLGGVEYYERLEGVVFDNYKLIRCLESGRAELYDLATDPGEQHSLMMEQPEQAARGIQLLDARAALRKKFVGEEQASESTDDALDPGIQRRLRSLGYLD